MQYICLGYLEPGTFEGLTDKDRHAVLDECFEHNDHLRANGHLVAEAPITSGSRGDPGFQKIYSAATFPSLFPQPSPQKSNLCDA